MESATARPWPGLPLGGLDLLLIVALALGSILLVDLGVAGRLPPTAGAIVGMLALRTAIIPGAIYVVAVAWRGASRDELGLVPAEPRWYLRAVLLALLMIPVVSIVNLIVGELTGQPFHNPQIPVVAATGSSWPALVGMVLVAGIVAPFAEELAFRGLLYGWLRQRLGVALGALGSALTFSLLHGVLTLIPAIAVLGVVLAIVYEKSRSLWPPFILHASFNTVMTLSVYAAVAFGALDSPPPRIP